MAQDEQLSVVESLERRLLTPRTRSSRKDLDLLIANDFLEFGSSGRVWTKAEIINSLLQSPDLDVKIDRVQSRELVENVILVTYRSNRVSQTGNTVTLRSSIWQKRGDEWQLIFHQGTIAQT